MAYYIFPLIIIILSTVSDTIASDYFVHDAFKLAELWLAGNNDIKNEDLKENFLEILSPNDNACSYSCLCEDMEVSNNILFRLNKDDRKKRTNIRSIAQQIVYCELLLESDNKVIFQENSQLKRLLQKNKLDNSENDKFAIVIKQNHRESHVLPFYHTYGITKEGLQRIRCGTRDKDERKLIENLIQDKDRLVQCIRESCQQQYTPFFAECKLVLLGLGAEYMFTMKKMWNNIFTINAATYLCLIVCIAAKFSQITEQIQVYMPQRFW